MIIVALYDKKYECLMLVVSNRISAACGLSKIRSNRSFIFLTTWNQHIPLVPVNPASLNPLVIASAESAIKGQYTYMHAKEACKLHRYARP